MSVLIPVPKEIQAYLHCGKCLVEMMEITGEVSPRDFQDIEVGWTPQGLQIWCKRHDCNIMHVDFEGVMHKAITTAEMEP